MQSFCASSIVQHPAECFVRLLLPENAIRRLFSHHKIKTALEDGVRPGTGRKKEYIRGRQDRIKVGVKIKAREALKFSVYPSS